MVKKHVAVLPLDVDQKQDFILFYLYKMLFLGSELPRIGNITSNLV